MCMISVKQSTSDCKKQQQLHMCIIPSDQDCNPPEDVFGGTEQV